MNTPKSSRSAARLVLAVSTIGMLSACAHIPSPRIPLARDLPPVRDVVPDPAPRPVIRKGDDARLLARRALDYGDANAARLGQARDAYQGVVDAYARPPQ